MQVIDEFVIVPGDVAIPRVAYCADVLAGFEGSVSRACEKRIQPAGETHRVFASEGGPRGTARRRSPRQLLGPQP